MPPLETLQVFQSLNRSPNARLELCAELGDGLSAALWSNHHDAQDYEAPDHHTLSCYIGGGTGTFRRDQPGTKGEDTRELLDNVQYAPSRGRFKVYLIDEVHMLSSHSFQLSGLFLMAPTLCINSASA